VFNFLPRDEKFFDHLETLAGNVTSSEEVLLSIILSYPDCGNGLQEIEGKRQAARNLAQDSLGRLDRAFITPLDREDILALINGLYSAVNSVAEISQRFRLYPLTKLYPNLMCQARNLLQLATEVERVTGDLRKKTTLTVLADGSMKLVRQIEENVKRDREQYLAELFAGHPDPIDLIKKKELHDLLEEGIDRLNEVTQTLARVLLKNA
jgi:uncharacterized protein